MIYPLTVMRAARMIAVTASIVLSPLVSVNALAVDGVSAVEPDAAVSRDTTARMPNNKAWQSGTYSAGPAAAKSAGQLQPFGSQLFDGGFRGVRSDGLNAGYQITPGDLITLRIWGAIEAERVLAVDSQGNVFIPSVGPVNVKGLTSQQMDSRIRTALRSVYPENVMVYTNLQGTQPVSVFVTGYVNKPGRYAGTPDDSAIHFLDLAGGIDSEQGSYRSVRIMRDGRLIAALDLYPFLLDGRLARPQLRDGDTLVVEERKQVVAVRGHVGQPYLYELAEGQRTGGELLRLARPQAGVSHVLVRGHRQAGPFSGYYSVEEFTGLTLNDGDAVELSADKRKDTIVVQLSGSYFGPSRYALPRDVKLQTLLDAIAVPEAITDVISISMQRESVAQQQQASLQESLKRLESTYLGAPSATPEEASIRVQEAKLIRQFIARAETAEPTGRLVIASQGKIANVRLQDGDVINIPEKSDSLLISGEVLVPQSVVFQSGRSALDYIEGAGGFSQHADDERILIVRKNGEVRDADEVSLKPGDEILVLPKAPTKNLQLASTLSQIIYQMAVVTKVVTDL